MVNGQSLTIKNEKEATQTRQGKVLPSRLSYVRYRIIPDSVTIPWRVRYPTTPPDEPIANITTNAVIIARQCGVLGRLVGLTGTMLK